MAIIVNTTVKKMVRRQKYRRAKFEPWRRKQYKKARYRKANSRFLEMIDRALFEEDLF